ncbi:MAG: DUF4252 domain-containing protein [Saprospiraceae bacterium]|nr:DUF4252 domain-containing protein [Saprospiraceae bacterium]MCB0625301.1 DUF4252 domain-containing protein [Saprospiraceae bacterium]MCB0676923.1 DUF4252 domain-containing protein [Saprospiraceae bacterium]MCB0682921.1 DUF4252 domain-containing protein [Saprospiraceae bacterium]
MRTLFFSLALLCSVATLSAQSQSIINFYERYLHHEKATQIDIDGWLLKLAGSFAEGEEAKLIEKISHLRVLVMEEENIVDPKDYQRLLRGIQNDNFEQLMQIRDGGSKIDCYVRESGDRITDLILTVNGEDEFVLLSLEGAFSLDDLRSLNLEVEGAEHLKKVPRA